MGNFRKNGSWQFWELKSYLDEWMYIVFKVLMLKINEVWEHLFFTLMSRLGAIFFKLPQYITAIIHTLMQCDNLSDIYTFIFILYEY